VWWAVAVPEPELSVVVCSTGEPTVGRTLESIRASVREAGLAAEILLVWQGDAAPPSLGDEVRELKILPVGLSYARNRGLQASAAPLVAFVDADEVVDSRWAAAIVAALSRAPVAAAFGPVAPLDDEGFGHCQFVGEEPRVFNRPSTPPWVVGTGGNMAFSTALLRRQGGFDLTLGAGAHGRSAEDAEIIVSLLRSGQGAAWVPEMIVYHPTKSQEERLASRYPYGFGVGRVARQRRDAGLACRYALSVAQAFGQAVRQRNARRRREVSASARGFATGLARRGTGRAPERLLERLPEEVRAELAGASPRPLPIPFRGDPHFLYAVGDDRLLHLYAEPPPRLRRAVRDREVIRRSSGAPGIPAVHALAERADSIWLLEDRLRGRPPGFRPRGRWTGPVADWVLALSGPPGPPLNETALWADRCAEGLDACPAELRATVRAAFEQAGELPAAHVHGDLQVKNVLVGADGMGVIDWETAEAEGLPGLDLVFMAVMVDGDHPQAGALHDLAAGRDPSWLPLRALLGQVGVDSDTMPAAVVAMLATWNAHERARRDVLSARPAPRLYHELLVECAPALARRMPVRS
jgi:hypothetical protein